MIFNSFDFLWLCPILLICYYLLKALIEKEYKEIGNYLLIAISYYVYMRWKPVAGLVLLYITCITYLFARIIQKRRETSLLWIGVVLTLFPLFILKYLNFVNGLISDILSGLSIPYASHVSNLLMPLGLSFYTLQAVGYLIDVYYQRIETEKNWWHYMLFVCFFPQIASGPISKAKLLLTQIRDRRGFDSDQFIQGLRWILWGMFMKVVLADRIGIYVDSIYNNYHYMSGVSCLVASLLYSFQLYGDFAGYSFMALGVGELFGFELVNNFRRPYLAVSVTDFWRRWHISLSIWLRDYIYIPLGGSRCSKIRNYFNIFITFLVSGLWHGANLTYIFWGSLHGIFQIIEKMLGLHKKESKGIIWAGRVLITFLLISFALIFFRMPTLTDGFNVIARITTNHDLTMATITPSMVVFITLALVITIVKDLMDEFIPKQYTFLHHKISIVRWTAYVGLLFLIVSCGVFDAGQFIYVSF
jgi:D-alanyl-lipoteichoic acid acyltransferase DltB (MBOAT superfamily)